MSTPDMPNRHVKTTKTVFGIIEILHQRGPCTLSELSEDMDLAKSTISEHLNTLQALRYIVREGNDYRISLKFLDHGITSRSHYSIYYVSKPILERLANETGESVILTVEEHGLGVPIHIFMGDRAVQTAARLGQANHMHCTAHGKAMLASYDPEDIDRIIDRYGLLEKTDNTITSEKALRNEFTTIRDQGYALSDCEAVEGVKAIASPVENSGSVAGAVCISGPKNRFDDTYLEDTLAKAILEAANEIELELTDFNNITVD